MPGFNCYSVNEDEGYTETGERITKGEAYILVLWDKHEHFFPDQPGRPESLIPGYVKPVAEGEGERKSLDDLKREAAAKAHAAEYAKVEKRLKRGGGKR